MRRSEAAFLAVATLLVCGLTAQGFFAGYPREALLFPLMVSVLMVAFVAMRVLEARQEAALAATADAQWAGSEEDEETSNFRSVLRPFLWVFASIPLFWLLGYVAGLTLFVFVFLLAHRTSLLVSLMLAGGTAAFIYLVFVKALQVLLPGGLLASLIG